MEPREFHKLAIDLAEKGYEAALRTAVSRAYYAALNHAARFLEESGVRLPQDHTFHDVVADNLVNVEAGLKHQLENLKMQRGEADYRVWEPWLITNVNDILEIADHIVAVIEEKCQA